MKLKLFKEAEETNEGSLARIHLMQSQNENF
jgi:hypothetical protein